MLKRLFLASALVLATAAPALAMHCPLDMAAIDKALAAGPQISAEDLEKVKALRAEGEALHKAGKHKDSVEKLGEAKKLLGIE